MSIGQSQALLAWGWVEKAQEALEEHKRQEGRSRRRQTPSGRYGRNRLRPEDARLLEEGVEYLTELTERQDAARPAATRAWPEPTLEDHEETTMKESTKAVREAIRMELERTPQATAAEIYDRVKEGYDISLPGKSSFTGYHLPAVREELGHEWDQDQQRWVTGDEPASDEPGPQPDEPEEAEPAQTVTEGSGDEHGVEIPATEETASSGSETSSSGPDSDGPLPRPTIDLRRNGKRYAATRRDDGRWNLSVEMDVPAEVAAELHEIAFAELFGLEVEAP